MKFSLYSKKNVLDEMQEQTLRKIGERGFCLMWGGLLAAVAVTVLWGLAYGYWMGAAFIGVSTGLLCFALLQFCVHLVQKNRKKLDDEPEEK